MEKTQRIKMKFSCSQDWDSMKETENGRFCSQCQHSVYDFTNKTIEEINSLRKENVRLCGMFRPEQVEQDLKPIEFKTFNALKYAAATTITFLGLELSSAKGQGVTSEHKTEQTNQTNGPVDIINQPVCPINSEEPVAVRQHRSRITFLRTKRNSWYISKRFPFVHKRSYRVLGAMF